MYVLYKDKILIISFQLLFVSIEIKFCVSQYTHNIYLLLNTTVAKRPVINVWEMQLKDLNFK